MNTTTETVRYINNNGRVVLHKSTCSGLARIHHQNCLATITEEQADEYKTKFHAKLCKKCFPEAQA